MSSLIKLIRTIHFLEQFIIYNACMYYVCIQIANRASLTEEQRKERLRIRREKETEDHKNQRLAISKDCSGVMKVSWREN